MQNNKQITLIWDLDGTLLDSYHVIVKGVMGVLEEYGVEASIEDVKKEVIIHSVSYYFDKIVKEKNIPFDEIKTKYSKITEENNDKIVPMVHSIELLEKLKDMNIKSYVFTHRGLSTEFVLKNTKLYGYFDEILTSKSGFKRKPNPEAINYLINKYNLDKNNTYYIGDRSLDIECAKNANIKSILYLPKGGYTIPSGDETYIVNDLLEIIDKLK